MGAPHKVMFDLHSVNLERKDPGNAGSIVVDRNPCYVGIVSAGAETRTLARPTRAGVKVTLYGKTLVGTVTLTVTGGYNTAGDTSFSFTTAGQYLVLESAYTGSAYVWLATGGSIDGLEANVTPGTVTASRPVVVDANKDVAGFRFVEPAADNAITAFATGGQASATAIAKMVNRVTVCATAGDSVKLPTSVAGMEIVIFNDGAADADVFPASGDAINGQAANVAVRLPVGMVGFFGSAVAGTWDYQYPSGRRFVSLAPSGAVTAQAETIFGTNQYTIRAGSLKAGNRLRVRASGTVGTANGTLQIRLRYGGVGGVLLLDTGSSITPVNGDLFQFDGCFVVTDVGGTGHAYGAFTWGIGTSVTGTGRYGKTASIAIDTTADKVLNVTQQLGTGAGSLTLDYLDVFID